MLRALLVNGLPVETTVHWHGVAIRNDMDGGDRHCIRPRTA
jgi:FtsP/CotA-like multicopper oxidase with cupredoxin domain